ncbi:ABC transporter ATP-binding protein [Leucothrix arctica]|uniref:Microcin ABC transporter ATP-binding protein n=1 Tax=Leucothrix arctica TaxID=1481894 RepID=A0A317CTC2_9GAMM|nr:ABC transporter ATP-binding protein [Leucothrix arctica]PWQ99562.1 microcin ABC transporter ATP-binding protein [Leucothrix arctica]
MDNKKQAKGVVPSILTSAVKLQDESVIDTTSATDNLVEIDNLTVQFKQGESTNTVVSSVSLAVKRGETLALVGESGSGKTVTAMSILRLLPSPPAQWPSGEIRYDGRDMLTLNERDLREMRGNRIGVIFQEPMMSLNPLHTVGKQIAEVLQIHKGYSMVKAQPLILKWLERVGIENPKEKINSYPHQLSGGQQQRVMIAMALANEPELLIADEPTTALDVTIQAQILDLINELKQELGMSVLFITHDLTIVKRFSDRVVVMKRGEIMEQGETQALFADPQHPYTKELLQTLHVRRKDTLSSDASVLLEAEDLKVWFPIQKGLLRRTVDHVKAVDGISLKVKQGESLGIVGESGSGKTTLAHALLKLVKSEGGFSFDGQSIADLDNNAMRPFRQSMQLIFQDPYGSLSPRMSVEEIIGEGLEIHNIGTQEERDAKVIETMRLVELEPEWKDRYPNEFSGGQRQRIAIARALIMEPKLVILDEPTSALDRTIQMQIVELLLKLQREKGLTYIFITHDLMIVQAMCHNIMVMRKGKVVEQGMTESIFDNPQEAYTKELLSAAVGN